MGKLRTIIAWLGVSTLGLVSGLPHVTLADDAGPGKEVRAIRHDLPIVLGAKVVINDVDVDGAQATATWTRTDGSSVSHFSGKLERRYNRWWLMSRGAMDGYEMSIAFGKNDANVGTLSDVRGRAPTESESWASQSGDGYFFFSSTVQSSVPIHVEAGTTIDVWFPFALDPSLYYGLTIAHADKPIGPIDGTLKANVVHYVLPAFTLPPGATLMGEIDGDPFHHSL